MLKIDNQKCCNSQSIANEFGHYFSSVGENFANKIPKPQKSINEYLKAIQSPQRSIFLTPSTIMEMKKLLSNLPNKGSCSTDNISNILLKKIKDEIAVPLTEIINAPIEQGVFPDLMKCALVVPLYKAKSKEEVTNYQPISLLMTISKIIEKVIYKRVYNYLNDSGQLYASQYGFRNSHSCEHAIGELLGNIVKNQHLNKNSVSIMLDLSKAFDTLQHTVIFEKLEKYGIRGNCLSWFKSYLSSRSLCVKCHDQSGQKVISNRYQVCYGAPQGSCMGPLIFLIFCNDLHHHLQFLESIQFADDTTLYMGHKSVKFLKFCLETDLMTIQDWFRSNKLTLNIDKTVILWFKQNALTSPETENIEICGLKLQCATFTKFLGLWLDNALNWKEHVRRLILKLSSRRSLLCRGKNFLTIHAKKVLYYAQIQSNLTYGLLIWGNMISNEDKTKLQRLQDKCVQLIDLRKSIADIYLDHNILTLTQLTELENFKIWYKHYHDTLPVNFSKLMNEDHTGKRLTKVHKYNTRRKHEINSPLATVSRYRSSFLVKGLQSYSSLPTEIKNETSYIRFVNKCKQYLQQKKN